MRKDVRILVEDAIFSNLTERQVFPPRGLFGGKGGPLGTTLLNPGTPAEKRLHSKGIYRLKGGDVVSTTLSGSGGYGSPFERDPEAVLQDVRDGFVSSDAAWKVYGVAVDTALWSVDVDETLGLRVQAAQNDGSA